MKRTPAPTGTLKAAVEAVRAQTDAAPALALVLGSGLGALAEEAEGVEVVPTEALPGYPRSTVEGHSGRLVFGRLEGRDVVFVQGRAHLYEGHAPRALGFPVRLVHALGARRLLVTNAAGGINPSFAPGTLMFITDHLNLTFASPLAGPEASAPRGPAAGGLARGAVPYDPAWTDQAEAAALRCGIATRRGVYCWTRGPSYETKAEIRAFAHLGADAVGMSTVPEVLQARRLEMPVLGLSTITNAAAGLGGTGARLSHEEVLLVGRRVRTQLSRLVRAVVRETVSPLP